MAKNPGDVEIRPKVTTDDVEKGVEDVNRLIDSFVKKVEGMGSKLRGFFQNLVPKDPIEVEVPEIEEPERKSGNEVLQHIAHIDDVKTETEMLKAAQKTADGLASSIRKMNSASEQGFRNPDQVLRFSDNLKEVETDVAAAREQLREFEELRIPTEEYVHLSDACDKAWLRVKALTAEKERLIAKGEDKKLTYDWRQVTQRLTEANEQLQGYQDKIAELDANGGVFIDQTAIDQYQELEEAIEEAERRLEISKNLIYQEAIAQQRLNVATAQEAVAAAQTQRERERAMQQLQLMQNQLAAVANQNVTPKPDPDALTGWEAFKEKLASVKQSLLTNIKDAAKTAFNAMKSGIKKAVGWLKNLRSHASSASGGVSGLVRSLTSMKTMLLSRIKQTFITQIVNGVTEGIQALAQFDKSVDNSISSIKNSFRQVGANIAVSLGSLISSIAPVITAMLDAVSAALNKLNALIAMLRGQKTVTIAKKQNDSYAESLNGAAGAAGKAAKAQKKYNATLSSYDELHKLSDNSDADKGAGSGGGAADMFEAVPVDKLLKGIPDSVIDVVNELKAKIKEGDWYGVGETLAVGLNGLVSKLDEFILKIKPKCVAAAEALGLGINGLADNLNWENLGITIGDGVNLVFSTLDKFLTTTNFETIGAGLAASVNGIVHRVNWDEVGTTLSDGFDSAIDFIYGAVENADWKGYGVALGKAVNNFIQKTDWKKAGETLGDAVIGLLTTITTVIQEIDWWAVGEAIIDFITGIDWGGVLEALLRAMFTVGGSIIVLIGSLIFNLFKHISDAIVKEAKSLGLDVEGGNIIKGLLNGMGAAIIGIFEWVKNHIFTPIVDAIKKVFGIASPATEMEPLGDNIIMGMLNGIKAGFGAIIDFFSGLLSDIWDTITNALGTAFDKGSELVDSILGGIKDAWDGLTGWISDAWDGIWGFLGDALQGFIDLGDKLVGAIWNGITGAWEAFKNFLRWFWEGLGDMLKGLLGGFLSVGGNLVGKIKDGIVGAWQSLRALLSNLWDGLKGLLTGGLGKFFDIGKDLVTGLKNGIESGWEKVKGGVSTVWGKVVGGAKSLFGIGSPSKVFAEIGGYLDEGLAQGIQQEKDVALRTTAQLAQAVSDEMYAGLSDGAEITPEVNTDKLRSTADRINSTLRELTGSTEITPEIDTAQLNASADRIRSALSTVKNSTDITPDIGAGRLESAADTIARKLSGLTDGFDAIVAKLETVAQAFAGVQVAFPDIATGALVPPRVRVSDAPAEQTGTSGGKIEQLLTDLIGLLTEQQTRDRDINITVPVQLDRNQLGRAVASYNLSGQRMSNGGFR